MQQRGKHQLRETSNGLSRYLDIDLLRSSTMHPIVNLDCSGRVAMPTAPDALQAVLDGSVVYLLEGEGVFTAARASIGSHAVHRRALVEMEQRVAAAREELADAVRGARTVQMRLDDALRRAHVAADSIAVDRTAACQRDRECRGIVLHRMTKTLQHFRVHTRACPRVAFTRRGITRRCDIWRESSCQR